MDVTIYGNNIYGYNVYDDTKDSPIGVELIGKQSKVTVFVTKEIAEKLGLIENPKFNTE